MAENEAVPAQRELPGTRPSPQEGDDVPNDTEPVERSAIQRIEAMLAEAAALWFAEVGEKPNEPYATSGNHFMRCAEMAYFAARPEPEPASPRPPRSGHHLYRLWSDDGRLVYVGVSTRLRARLAVHRRRMGHLWSTATWEEHENAEAMLTAEAEAIMAEDPALNRAGVR